MNLFVVVIFTHVKRFCTFRFDRSSSKSFFFIPNFYTGGSASSDLSFKRRVQWDWDRKIQLFPLKNL